MGPQKLPNFGTWEEGKYEIGNMEYDHFEIWTRESTGPLESPIMTHAVQRADWTYTDMGYAWHTDPA